jgi:hypothetical protein
MPRSAESIDAIIQAAVSQALQKVVPAIQRHVATLAAEELERSLAVKNGAKGARGGSRRARARARPADLTKWVADKRARRVPKFVIEMTGGLDTKKKVVAKYGENSVFEKGKPLPKASRAA